MKVTRKLGQRVRIMGVMREFIGKTGSIIHVESREPRVYRVELDEPVEIPSVGLVRSDLWEGRLLQNVRE